MPHDLLACHECDLLQRQIPPGRGGIVTCGRCGAVLMRNRLAGNDRALALIAAALILLILANAFPIVGIEAEGLRNATTLMGAVHTLWQEDMWFVALLVGLTTVVLPAFELVAMIFILASLRRDVVPAVLPLLMRMVQAVRPWGMVEVFMLGVLVSVVKLAHLASIVPGIALWAFAGLMLLLSAAAASFNAEAVWARCPVKRWQ